MDTSVSVEHARRVVLEMARATPAEPVALADAVGRTLAGPVVSRGPQPPFDASAMDGFAVRWADLGAPLPVVGTAHAGDVPEPLAPGTAVAIMTGAPVPRGADTVVPVERATRDGDAVRFDATPTRGSHIRRAGEALADGAEVLPAGTLITPGAVSVLASVGAAHVPVRARPLVAVVATGDELVPADRTPGLGQIRDSNGPGLAAQVVAAGGAVVGLVARDTAADLDRALDEATGADVVVVAGGVSMGERDRVRPALDARGAEWAFWQVRQRPGKPLAVGAWDGRPVVGLPGNPVSAAVCFEVYVRPLLAAMLGRPAEPVTEPAVLAETIPKKAGLHTFARVTARRDADGRLHLSPAGAQGSHVAQSLALADGLAHLPADWPNAPAGAVVAFEQWGWG
ncbi:gephyrin-like molybdotransferase Glp [Rubrivirga sp.]|uniref:molybdopterin molybdotransferase MoeA n=1 Tax=Rubrivirga sp. TaxID=1885344 RepID=UPI003B529173